MTNITNTKNVLEELTSEIEIQTQEQFTIKGKIINVGLNQQETETESLTNTLTSKIYEMAFTRSIYDAEPEPGESYSVTEILAKANMSKSRWDKGWIVNKITNDGKYLVRKNNVERELWPGEFILSDPGAGPTVIGSKVQIYCPADSTKLQEGVYFSFSTTTPLDIHSESLLRIYWNISQQGAPTLINQISERLNRFSVPYRLKCMGYSQLFSRIDSMVLYVPLRYFQITLSLCLPIHKLVHTELGNRCVLFTKPIAPGLSIAEDFDVYQSFGMHRCNIVATGLVNAWLNSEMDNASKMRAVIAQFAHQGIDLEKPYLNTGSADIYDTPHEQEYA